MSTFKFVFSSKHKGAEYRSLVCVYYLALVVVTMMIDSD